MPTTVNTRWRVERARSGEPTRMGRVVGRVWTLVLIDPTSGSRETAFHIARRTASFRPGQELDGRLVLEREGLTFHRDLPHVGAPR